MRRCPLARQKLEVTLETVTPLFLAGADGKTPELRPPSFRGAMRFWLRALLGGVLGDDVEAVRREEAKVFGNTEGASPVVVRIAGLPSCSPLEKPFGRSGRYYLLWSLLRQQKELLCISPHSSFEVVLQPRPGVNQSQALWRASAALWLTVRLGGIGARSRRTLGSLTVVKEEIPQLPFGLPSFVSAAKSPSALASELEDGLRQIQDIFGNTAKEPARRFNVLHKDRCSIWIVSSDNWREWEQAAEDMGHNLREFRQSMPLRNRAALGLPLRNVSGGRYASPLILTIAPLNVGGYVGIAVMFEPVNRMQRYSPNIREQFVRSFVELFAVKEEVQL